MALVTCLKLNDSEVSMGSWRVHPDFRGNKAGIQFADACKRMIIHNFGEPMKEYGAALHKPFVTEYFKSPSPGKLMREWVGNAFSMR